MLYGIDISNHQGRAGFKLSQITEHLDFVIIKATGGASFVDKYCDGYVQEAKRLGLLWGFYHFAHDIGTADAISEADYFVDNCTNYFGEGIPVLDWERDTVSVAWVNAFVARVYERTKVRCWIYANPWRFNKGGVDRNYARWIAAYPLSGRPTLLSNPGNIPATDGNVVCWQYSGTGKVSGYSGNLDLNHYYGSLESWGKYARGDRQASTPNPPNVDNDTIIVEDESYKVTIDKK